MWRLRRLERGRGISDWLWLIVRVSSGLWAKPADNPDAARRRAYRLPCVAIRPSKAL